MLANHALSNVKAGAAVMPAKKTIKRKSEAVVDNDKTPKKVKGEFHVFSLCLQ